MKWSALIPKSFRRRGVLLLAAVIVRGVLNFIGLAALLPVLVLVADPGRMASNPWLGALYRAGGFSSEAAFAWCVCGTVVGIIVLKGVLNIAITRFQTRYMFSLYRHYSETLFRNYYRRGLLFFKSKSPSRLAYEVNGVSLVFVQRVLTPAAMLFSDAVLVLLVSVALLAYHAVASLLLAVVFLPVVWGWFRLQQGKLQEMGKEENDVRRRQSRLVLEAFRGYPEIEIGDAFAPLVARFDEGVGQIAEFRRRTEMMQQAPAFVAELCVVLALVVLVALRADAVLFGVFALAALRLLPTVRGMIYRWITLRSSLYTVDVIRDACEMESAPEEDPTDRLPFDREIVAEKLSFAFEDGKPVLKDFDLTIRKGERVGIKGSSGAGKSTLFNLLLGFYPPQKGSIRIDGVPLTMENRRAWQRNVGYVPQEVFLTDGTIAENVALAGESDRERVVEALKAASLAGFVASLPAGIDTRVGEGGCRLSGGQRQRIGIARALYKGADVLFFDEATSSLDSKTESEINEALQLLSEQRADLTLVVISHRESTLAYCDRIVELTTENGL